MFRALSTSVLVLMVFGVAPQSIAVEPITIATVEPPPEISPDEPLAPEFSLDRAARALDRAALNWQKSHACTACHTMLPYMMSRAALASVLPASGEVRTFFEQVVAGKVDPMPNYTCHDVNSAVAVEVATALALNDRCSTGKLHPLTRQALDRMWTFQRTDGSWEWPFRDTPPLKSTEHYGVTLAAVAAGMAPDDYAHTPAALTGIDGIRSYLAKNPALTLHEQAMTLWASVSIPQVLSPDSQQNTLARMMSAQRPDGGWSMASLIDNTADPALKDPQRAVEMKSKPGYGTEFLSYIGRDGVYKSSLDSDGYATGFAIYVSRQAGVPATDPRIQRGVTWLKSHQRASGRWFTHSQSWHTKHMVTNAGTAYAVLALHACGEIPGW